jgi:hypothetical protein
VLLHNTINKGRLSLGGTTKDELVNLSEMVDMKMSKAKAQLQ